MTIKRASIQSSDRIQPIFIQPVLLAALVVVLIGTACSAEPSAIHGGNFATDAAVATMPTKTPEALCTAAHASEALPPRADLISTSGGATNGGGGLEVVHTSDLFSRFRAVCGACHVEQSSGGKHIADEAQFAAMFDSTWMDRINNEDPTKFMPPPPLGKPYSTRMAGDPVVELVRYLTPWMAAGRPTGTYTVASAGAKMAAGADYSFSPTMSAGMTNLGTCIPPATTFAGNTSGTMESLDAMFAATEALPPNISQTDLTTFDSNLLASTGVIAYVPTYPLYSDGSGKLRHIRVPKGQSVKFDKDKQTFEIPPNTRFYKTFFRKIVDRTGQIAYRKMETRLIVAKPDMTSDDGSIKQNALFGTYVWTDDELTANLSDLPYRDGTPFADQVRTYFTDEKAYQDVVDSIGPTGQYDAVLQKALTAAMKKNPGLQRHYAIPGRFRCQQCHMGSPTHDFVLGFFPLQIARRPTDTGGTYEATGADEINQLQRLIDYGVITGMDSPTDVLLLEQMEGGRKPRTDAELTAQGYMIGNCAHCHNPRGFPSISKPELKPLLNFLPDGQDGGIFEFKLETTSPIRFRGANGDIPIPYITPSLRDYPVADVNGIRIDSKTTAGSEGTSVVSLEPTAVTWTPKYLSNEIFKSEPGVASCEDASDPANQTVSAGGILDYCDKRRTGYSFVPAPWRSLIYRNVDTPFPYFDDYVPFPHMPMNSPGFDCRAPRIMGEWMVGLPAARIPIPGQEVPPEDTLPGDTKASIAYEDRAQPYEIVTPDDPRFEKAKIDAAARLAEYRNGVRYPYCEDQISGDIFDPVGLSMNNPHGYVPDPINYQLGAFGPTDPASHPSRHYQPSIGVPYHSHWINYDPTDPPPPWSPRRPEWKAILADGTTDTSLPAGYTTLPADKKHERELLARALNESVLTPQLRTYATTELPYGLWKEKPECQQVLASQKTASMLTGADRPAWLDKANASADARVYMMSPGAALYQHICFNCHGPKGDGKGIQVDLLTSASDGDDRPANFLEGLFGPSNDPGVNLLNTFAAPFGNQQGETVGSLWGSRYMAWMTLGGTLKRIPGDIIHLVEATKVLGAARVVPGEQEVTGNMLNLARQLCAFILPVQSPSGGGEDGITFNKGNEPSAGYPQFNPNGGTNHFPLITTNGDSDMWQHLCTDFSPAVVRVYAYASDGQGGGDAHLDMIYYAVSPTAAAHPDAGDYPASAPVLDHNRVVQSGVGPSNLYPACFKADPASIAWAAGKPIRTKTHMPDCPADFLAKGTRLWSHQVSGEEGTTFSDNIEVWKFRGAIATAMSVFSYLQTGAQFKGGKPYYNECQLLR